MAIGAYSSSVLTLNFEVSFWIALPLSGLIAGAIGIIGGAPSLRIKGMYLAMATIAIPFCCYMANSSSGDYGLVQGALPSSSQPGWI